MGHYVLQTHDPDMLDVPNDTDLEDEGYDEAWDEYSEYRAYVPDLIKDMTPLSQDSLDACEDAERAIDAVRLHTQNSDAAKAAACLLLYDEAVSTTQAENYHVSCTSMLEYANFQRDGEHPQGHDGERAALDALAAIKDFTRDAQNKLSLDIICETNATFSRTSSRSEFCGALRERPVYIGSSLFDAEYVAPPAEELEDLVADLIHFVNTDNKMDPIAKAAIAQVQLVTIHPFEDGNGRTSRALSQRLLQKEGLTGELIIPITSATLINDADYISSIHSLVNPHGPADPNSFVKHFANACKMAAEATVSMMQRLETVLDRWSKVTAPLAPSPAETLERFSKNPVMTAAVLESAIGTDAQRALSELAEAKVLQLRKSRFSGADVFFAPEILDVLEAIQTLAELKR